MTTRTNFTNDHGCTLDAFIRRLVDVTFSETIENANGVPIVFDLNANLNGGEANSYNLVFTTRYANSDVTPIEIGEDVTVHDGKVIMASVPFAVACDKDIPVTLTEDDEEFRKVMTDRITKAIEKLDDIIHNC